MSCLANDDISAGAGGNIDVFGASPLFDSMDDFGGKHDHTGLAGTFAAASDPTYISWDNHRVSDDLFTSPVWTDPSPALTDNNSFDTESCGPSPLLADDLDGPSSDVAHMPLFGDMTLFSPQVHTEGAFEAQSKAAMGVPSISVPSTADFTLFPEVAPASPPRAQMAFNPAATQPAEDPAIMLLRALQSAAVQRQTQGPVSTASPHLISSPPKDLIGSGQDVPQVEVAARKPPLMHSATEPLLTVTKAETETEGVATEAPRLDEGASAKTRCRRGTKRRLGIDDLLPLDAPIQSRNYLGPSATSRKDFFEDSNDRDNGPTPEELVAIAAETDPLKAKRLSNTLAARRSRHRKAQERAELEGTIDELRAELAAYKKRLQRTEEERDSFSEQLKRCKCSA
ncbi:unnamed protein product [Parajaminaea phylloscopi]